MLIIAHRILIGAAILFGLFYTVWEFVAYRRTHEITHLVTALIAAVVTAAMGYYLKNLKRFVS